ncbi:MAG: hypothetical protein Q8Q76_12410 [Methylotenera sp.]|nr:hypothetical protein [Methylotenera sp.]
MKIANIKAGDICLNQNACLLLSGDSILKGMDAYSEGNRNQLASTMPDR